MLLFKILEKLDLYFYRYRNYARIVENVIFEQHKQKAADKKQLSGMQCPDNHTYFFTRQLAERRKTLAN